MRLFLLGRFELRSGGALVDLPISAQRVLAFLALHERAIPRSQVAGRLWANSSTQRSSASLRSSLWRLNRPGHRLVESRCSMLNVVPDISVDTWELTRAARGLMGGSADVAVDAGLLSGAGDLLPDWSDEWVLLERERLRMLRLHALEAFVERCLTVGRYGDASEAAIAAVSSEPLRESAQRALIRVHLAEGNRGDAIRQYRRLNDLLHHELGVAPSGQLTALIDELLIK